MFLVLLAVWILPVFGEPVLKDQNLVAEEFVSDIPHSPTTMAFIGNDLLVLQKTDGQVRLVRDGVLQDEPVLDVPVSGRYEQGMLGITIVDSTVYLYFTESTEDGGEPLGNHIYRYEWTGKQLTNPVLVKKLPGHQFYHNGGAMVAGLDGTVYAVIGDQGTYGVLQNHPVGGMDNTSVILPVVPEGPYYAMGVRNSFGLAIDPVTGSLWDTENGDNEFDEINFVPKNFNSGWDVIMGPATESKIKSLPGYDVYEYSDPEFSWQQSVAPTAITFVDSKSFPQFKNNLFAADCIYGNLYKFELNSDRTGFVFKDSVLADNVVNMGEPMDEIIFGTDFGCITDMEVGPDGLLYILSLSDGTIYRIMPQTMMIKTDTETEYAQPTAFPLEYGVYVIIVTIIIVGIIIYLAKAKRKSK